MRVKPKKGYELALKNLTKRRTLMEGAIARFNAANDKLTEAKSKLSEQELKEFYPESNVETVI